MARFDFRLPDIGEGVAEGEVIAWLVKAGDVVREDQPIVEVMTDKATVTITAPKAGTVLQLCADAGQKIAVAQVLIAFEVGNGGGAPSAAAVTTSAVASETVASAVGDLKEDLPGTSWRRDGVGGSWIPGEKGHGAVAYFMEKPLATPATRKRARDLNVDLRRVKPSGAGGRVTQEDVERHQAPHEESPLVSAPSVARQDVEERVPFMGIRRKIAERTSLSKRTAPHFTFIEECDCTNLRDLRDRLRPRAEAAGVKLTYLAFIAKAVTGALLRHPLLNSTLDEAAGQIVLRKHVHLGIAAATEQGLVVPVIEHAQDRPLLELAREIERVASGAKEGRLRANELTGSTFTITSLGQLGGFCATPIINYPEVAILGVHRIKQRPVVRQGAIVIGEVMMLSLSFDHRVIDGDVGAAFAYDVIERLEDPALLLLDP